MKRRPNLPLIFGALLIALTTVLAIWGPDLAPRDPLDRGSQLIRIDGVWELAPFSPGTPGFPLGSDQGGRDILSRLLWAVRPTMQLVLVVASVRLGVGILVGIVSGAGRGRFALLLETLTTAALAVPSLLIALAIVLKLWPTWRPGGPEMRAFIIGLSITGWAETAQVVREGTRILLRQQYVEAARSLGGSAVHLFRRHVLPHLMPLVWIQMAFEVGATLMLVAGMGFLGLYVGGTAVPLEGDPFTLAAAPELGEMLSTSIDVIIEPWGMVAAGGVVFLTVLGFNLLGQGLRLRLARSLPRRETIAGRAGFWLEEHLTYPLRTLADGPLRQPLRIAAVLVVLAAVIRIGMDLRPSVTTGVEQLPTQVEQAFAPLPTPTATLETPSSLVLWTFESPTGAPIPPLIASDGSIYLLTHEDELFAFDPDGALRWQQVLAPAPFKARISQSTGIAISPIELDGGSIGIVSAGSVYALGPDGERIWESPLDAPPAAGCCAVDPSGSRLHLVDSEGGLYAIGPAGERLWKLEPQDGPGTPESDLVTAADGRVFFAVRRGSDVVLNAVSAEGGLLWQSFVPRDRFRQGFVGANQFRWLSLSPSEGYVFLSGDVYRTETGEWIDFDLESALAEIEAQLAAEDASITGFGDPAVWPRRVFAGAGGRILMTAQYLLIEWAPAGAGFEMTRFLPIHGAYPVTGWRPPAAVTGDRIVLMAADPNDGDDIPALPWDTDGWFLIWSDLAQRTSGEVQVPVGDYLASLDPESGAALVCRAERDPAVLTCDRWAPAEDEPETLFSVDGIRSIKFIELDPDSGRVVVFGKDNVLYVAGVGEPLGSAGR